MALARLDSVFTRVFLGRDPGSRVVLWLPSLWLRAAGSALTHVGSCPSPQACFCPPFSGSCHAEGRVETTQCLRSHRSFCSLQFVDIGIVTSIEVNHKQVDVAKKGQEVCVKIEPIPGESPKMYGRHFEATDILVSKVSRSLSS